MKYLPSILLTLISLTSSTMSQSIGETRFGSLLPGTISSIRIDSRVALSDDSSRVVTEPEAIRSILTFLRNIPYRPWSPEHGTRSPDRATYRIIMNGWKDEVLFCRGNLVFIGKTAFVAPVGTIERVDSLFQAVGR